MSFQIKPRKLLNHSCCVVTKGHTYLSKHAGKCSKSTKDEVFLKEFFHKFEDIWQVTTTDAFTFSEDILIETLHFLGVGCF